MNIPAAVGARPFLDRRGSWRRSRRTIGNIAGVFLDLDGK